MKSILLSIILFFSFKCALGVESIEKTETYEYFFSENIKNILNDAKIKKHDDKQKYIDSYLINLSRIDSSQERLVFISSAIEFSYYNEIDIKNNYIIDEYKKLIIDNFEINKYFSCRSINYFYFGVKYLEYYESKIPNLFIDNCEDYLPDTLYGYVLYYMFNIYVVNYNSFRDADKNINRIYKILLDTNLNPGFEAGAEYQYGLYSLVKLRKSETYEQIIKLKNFEENNYLAKYFYYQLKINYMHIYERNEDEKFISLFQEFKNFEIKSEIGELNTNSQYLEAYASYIFKLIDQSDNNLNNYDSIFIKKEFDELFRLKMQLSESHLRVLDQYIIMLLNEYEEVINEDLKFYILNGVKEIKDIDYGFLTLNRELLETNQLKKDKKYKKVIQILNYLNTKDLDSYELALTDNLFDSYLNENEFEKAVTLLQKSFEVIVKKTNEIENYLTYKDDFEGVIDRYIRNAYDLWAVTNNEDQRGQKDIGGDIFFQLVQIKNFNEVNNSLRTSSLKLASKYTTENMADLKELIKIEQELIYLSQNKSENINLIAEKIKILNNKVSILKNLPLYKSFNAPIKFEEAGFYLENDEALIHFVETKFYIFKLIFISDNGTISYYIDWFKKKDLKQEVEALNANINNLSTNNLINYNKLFDKELIKNLIELDIKKLNIINSSSTSKLVFEALPYSDNFVVDYFSVNYLPSVKHFINLKKNHLFKIGIFLDENEKGIVIKDVLSISQFSNRFERDDLIIKINNKHRPKNEDLSNIIENTKKGDYIDFTIERDNKLIEFKIQKGKNIKADYDYVAFGDPFFNKNTLNKDIKINTNILRSSSNNKKSIKKLYESLSSLEETKEEIINGSKNFEKSQIFLKNDAKEKNFYSLDNKKIKVLTIATHAIEKNSDLFIEPALVLSYDENENDLGLLTTTDITSVNIDIDLVILSACNTSSESLDSNLLFSGLARAFLTIGANNLIISRWPVDSLYTTEFMNIFYEYINDYSYREAFNMAQKDIKNEYPDPYYWSSFIFLGI